MLKVLMNIVQCTMYTINKRLLAKLEDSWTSVSQLVNFKLKLSVGYFNPNKLTEKYEFLVKYLKILANIEIIQLNFSTPTYQKQFFSTFLDFHCILTFLNFVDYFNSHHISENLTMTLFFF